MVDEYLFCTLPVHDRPYAPLFLYVPTFLSPLLLLLGAQPFAGFFHGRLSGFSRLVEWILRNPISTEFKNVVVVASRIKGRKASRLHPGKQSLKLYMGYDY